jgi:putative GTP pyrophosphokinase
LHFVVSFKDDWLKLPPFKRFAGKKAELQIRTILEHAWASIDWKIRYKAEENVPKDMKRALYRISALLESVDLDFTNLNKLSLGLTKRYEASIKENNLAIEANQESLELFLSKSDTVHELEGLARAANFQINHQKNPRTRNPMLNLSITLQVAGITRISELKEQLKAAKDGASIFLRKLYQEWDKNTKEAPNRPKMLDIDLGSLIRLLVIERSSKEIARKILQKSPFGSRELNKAVQGVVAEKPSRSHGRTVTLDRVAGRV